MIEESLYASGYIYSNDFNEPALAAAQYEDLTRRYPQSEYMVPSYYYLYRLYSSTGKDADALKYRTLLLNKAPESVYAQIVLDPAYLDRLMQQKSEAEQIYEQTYLLYNQGEYRQVISMAGDAIEHFPDDALTPKFAYLKALSEGKTAEGDAEAMRNAMKTVVATYSETDIAVEAQKLIDFIDGQQPEMKQTDQAERAKTLYTHTTNDAFIFVWMIDAKENINQLAFDVQSFNIDRFTNVDLKYETVRINDRHVLLTVKGLLDYQRAQAYLRTFVMDLHVTQNARYDHTTFLIADANYRILIEDKKPEDYLEFFKREYIK
jgi:outer membrane protein assembly factor BamD (BamD/ComL family)